MCNCKSKEHLKLISQLIEPPYIHNMEEQYGITDEKEQKKILYYIFKKIVTIKKNEWTNQYDKTIKIRNVYLDNKLKYTEKNNYPQFINTPY